MKHTNEKINLGEGIAKQEFNLIFVIDNSGSMGGEKIGVANNMMREMPQCLGDVQEGTSDATIKISAMTFSDRARWVYDEAKAIESFRWNDVAADGETNFSDVFDKLAVFLEKKKNKGQMPDRGGIAPCILFLSDGESTAKDWRQHLALLQKKPWYKAALVYFGFIGEETKETRELAEAVAGSSERVLFGASAAELARKIKIIAITASQVKSQSGSASGNGTVVDDNQAAQDAVAKALDEDDDDEW